MNEIQQKLNGRRPVASVSGGKDSAAMSLWLTEQGIEHDRVFCDTGWEAQRTYEYLRGPLTAKLGPIQELRAVVVLTTEERERIERAIADLPLVLAEYLKDSPMVIMALRKGMFPAGKARWCTEYLKEQPIKRHLEMLIDGGAEIVNAVGIRAAESEARSNYAEWTELQWARIVRGEAPPPELAKVAALKEACGSEYDVTMPGRLVHYDCDMWRPLLRWSVDDVVAIHRRHDLPPNPLYLIPGIERVGCSLCIRARKSEIRATAERMPQRIDLMRELETAVGRLAAERMAGQEIRNPNWTPPAWFQAPIGKDGSCWPIDKVAGWSRTSRGGRQFELFAPQSDEGCLRWGLCEAAG